MAPRFVVGIDLGTTNCAAAYVDTGAAPSPPVQTFLIPQVVQPGLVEPRPLLPSFLYLPGAAEQPAGALRLPWDPHRDYCVGEFARVFGSQVPTRLAASAKSWLCHPGVDRKAPILPIRAPEGGRKISPLEACMLYLRHIAEAWNFSLAADNPELRLEIQDIVLTVPASFDAAARELTIEAARKAGFEHLTLLEEPQAAFYSWIDALGDGWRQQVQVGDLILVADVGGGTTDFTLIEVAEESGALALSRQAVGDHLLLGGDNMDLALAHTVAAALSAQGHKLDTGQMLQLAHACRQAKEQMLSDAALANVPVTVLGRGRSVVGGSIRHELSRAEVERVICEGFLPACERTAVPERNRTLGLQELGLPYVADPGITRHLAHFLTRQGESLGGKRRRKTETALPTAVLFNGGVFKAALLRQRLLSTLADWAHAAQVEPPRELSGADLDLAVARGAAYYGLVRRGRGVRIRGGTPRAYYIGIASSAPAVPGLPPPIKALCVAPFGMEEGTEAELPKQEFGLVIGEEAEFRFLGSTTRRDDLPGTVVEDWQDEIQELAPLRLRLEAKGGMTGLVPVHLHSKVTEVGLLELWCASRDGKQRWKLEYNVRQ